jgi:hypothetical protein
VGNERDEHHDEDQSGVLDQQPTAYGGRCSR